MQGLPLIKLNAVQPGSQDTTPVHVNAAWIVVVTAGKVSVKWKETEPKSVECTIITTLDGKTYPVIDTIEDVISLVKAATE